MADRLIYLDNNATTKVDEKVLDEMLPYFSENYANPGGMYDFAGKVGRKIADAREAVKEFMGANDQKEIYFTGSGSEGANTAIRGVVNQGYGKKHIITTKVEHPCVLNTYKDLEKQGHKVTYLGVDADGNLNMKELEESIRPETALVSLMAANNETGIIFPYEKVAEIVKQKNPETKVFVDAVQAAGKIKMDFKNTKVDFASISGHKFHAPKGIGALYVKAGTAFAPLITGGHQERGKRAGTENTASIIAIGKAAELAYDSLGEELTRVKKLRDKLERNILHNIFNARLNSSTGNRVPNTTNIGFEYIEGELILLYLNELGICASSGSACTSGSLDPSHVLRAMGVPFTALHGSIRLSLSRFTTEEEIDFACEKFPEVIKKINKLSPFQKELAELESIRSHQN